MSRSKDGYRPARQKTGESQLSIESIPDLPCENTCSVIPSERHEKLNFFERYRGFCTCLSGLGVLLVGFLLGVGYFSVTKTTRSVKYVETQIPTLVTASMMVLSGLLTIIASKRRLKYLVVSVVFLSIISTMFCFVSFVYLLTEVNVNLSKLQDCSFSEEEKTCHCYVPDDDDESGRRHLKFSAVQSCLAVRGNLKNLVYGVSVLFGVGFIISMITAVASSYLLYTEQKKNKQERRRSCDDDRSIRMTSITTQTQESCLQPRSQAATSHSEPEPSTSNRGRRNFSVGTQTPIYMMPVAQLVYDINNPPVDYRMGILLPNERDEPPPPYSDAITTR